jgi:glutamyl/glutaminyl-tRNA synthetase
MKEFEIHRNPTDGRYYAYIDEVSINEKGYISEASARAMARMRAAGIERRKPGFYTDIRALTKEQQREVQKFIWNKGWGAIYGRS